VSLIIGDLRRLRRITTNPKDGGARTEVGPYNTIMVAMEVLLEAEKIALEKELEEEMAATRRKPVCFQKTHTRVIKKTIPTVTTITTMAPMVTSNLTPKDLVKLVDVSVASKYGADTQFTRIIADDMHNTIESFKTYMHNTLPRQVRMVVQWIQGEAQSKQPIGSPSTPYPGNTSAPGNIGTPYPGNTSAPGNMGTLYLGSTTTPSNMGVLANTSTPHPGSTSDNIIYVDANSPYPGSTSMGNPGFFLLQAYLTQGEGGCIHFR
jgi:hypothetical protein